MSIQNNITWHQMKIDKVKREANLGQKGLLIWITGLSGSGKSTIGSALESSLYNLDKATYLLDGDNLRHGINSDLGFSDIDRTENIRRIGEISKLFVDAGLITIATFVSPFKKDRNFVRSLLGDYFIEVYIDCDLDTCIKRDPKGLYEKALSGEISQFTGISSPYEKPDKPELVINTVDDPIEESINKIITFIKENY